MTDGIRVENGYLIYMNYGALDRGEQEKAYPIGQALLDFLEIDFSEQEEFRQYAIRLLNDRAEMAQYVEKIQELIDRNQFMTTRTLFLHDEDIASAEEEAIKELAFNTYFYPKFTQLEHPYFKNLELGAVTSSDPSKVIINLSNFEGLKSRYLELIRFACDVDFRDDFKSLTPQERYYIYRNSFREELSSDEMSVRSTFIMLPPIDNLPESDHRLFYTQSNDPFDFKPSPITPETIAYTKTLGARGFFAFHASTLSEFVYLEAMSMIQNNVKIRKCKNCGRYFILKGNYGAQYCDRIAPGASQNCQTVGAQREYKSKVNSDPVLKEYARVYKRYYARTKNGRMSMSAFEAWSTAAQGKRAGYLSGAISADAFIEWLSQDGVESK